MSDVVCLYVLSSGPFAWITILPLQILMNGVGNGTLEPEVGSPIGPTCLMSVKGVHCLYTVDARYPAGGIVNASVLTLDVQLFANVREIVLIMTGLVI